MKKRTAEKIISRSILALASYRKTTMGKALRKRPRFWTVANEEVVTRAHRVSKRLRVEFAAEMNEAPGLLIDPGVQVARAP
jgi:hypothetical protein